MTTVFTFTLSTGDVVAVYREITAGQAIIATILLCLLILEIFSLVRRYTSA